MKCPACTHSHPYKEGMTCGKCGYEFALNPKEGLKIGDGVLYGMIQKLSGEGVHRFTQTQLSVALYQRQFRRSKRGRVVLMIFFGLLLSFIMALVLSDMRMSGRMIALSIGLFLSCWTGLLWWGRNPSIDVDAIELAVQTYLQRHPSEHLIDRRHFANGAQDALQEEFQDYAPERILIVESDELVDFLLLNRFHLDYNALIVSSSKYPNAAFAYYQQCIEHYPDVPIFVLHDLSVSGLRLVAQLKQEQSWGLAEREVVDLGLFPEDLALIKYPMWIKWRSIERHQVERALVGRTPPPKQVLSKLEEGRRVAVGSPPPSVLLGILAGCVVMGVGFSELMAHPDHDSFVMFDSFG